MFYKPKSSNLFNLFGLFAKEETDSNFEKWMADIAHLMRVDVTSKELEPVKNYYEVDKTPFLIVLNHDWVSFSEIPNDQTEDWLK